MWLLLSLITLAFTSILQAQFVPVAQFQVQDSTLTLTTTDTPAYDENCYLMTVTSTFGGAAPKTVGSDLTVTPGGAGFSFYSDSGCTQSVATVQILNGNSSQNFWFTQSGTGSVTMTASAASYTDGSYNTTLAANPFIWDGGGGNALWATGGNWSGGSAPGSSDIAIFDGSCAANCSPTIGANTTIGGIRMNTGYTGTINHGAVDFHIESGDYVQHAGTFSGDAGGTGEVYVKNGTTYITGGSITFPAGVWRLGGSYYVSNSPTMTIPANSTLELFCTNATWYCDSGVIMDPGSSTYENFSVFTIRTSIGLNGSTFKLAKDITLEAAALRSIANGTIEVGGDFTSNNKGYYGPGTIKLTGNPAGQTVSAEYATTELPTLVVEAGVHPVTFTGTFKPSGYQYISSGTFTTTGNTLHIYCRNGRACDMSSWTLRSGTVNYNNVIIEGYRTTIDLNGETWNVLGDLTLDGTSAIRNLDNGHFKVSGNFTFVEGFRGTATMEFTGTNNQSITTNGTAIMDGDITVNKSGGTLSLATNFIVNDAAQDFTITNGTVDMAGFNLTVGNVLTIGAGTTLTQNGGTLSYGSLTNNGTLNP